MYNFHLLAIHHDMKRRCKHYQKVVWMKIGTGRVPAIVDKGYLTLIKEFLFNRGV